jgi:hypothetical protein
MFLLFVPATRRTMLKNFGAVQNATRISIWDLNAINAAVTVVINAKVVRITSKLVDAQRKRFSVG